MKPIFSYFSLFSGIGGFEVGIQAAMPYAQCVGFSEIDPYAKSIYQNKYKHKDYGDVTKINENELPEFDCLVGGFPCQPFSVSGSGRGFEDSRGTLFFDVARILRAKRPKMFILENVRGLLSNDEGQAFGVIIKTLDELRYDVQWQVLNCKYHGTPQDRNRVFIVGYSRTGGKNLGKILPIRYACPEITQPSERQTITTTLLKRPADGHTAGSYIIEGWQTKITGNVICFNSERGFRKKNNNKKDGGSGILSREDEMSYALTKKHANHIIQINPATTQGARVYDPEGIGISLNSKGGGMGANTGLYAVNLLNNFRIRRLMPLECERLQDFPDDWTKYGVNGESISDSQRYACIGNAVNTKVVKIISEKMRDVLIDSKTEKKILTPKIVSFSGGRTSAMMLLQLLEKGELKQWRGDCVVFNNTSAEHHATYAFVSRIKHITETQYNIPFFMIEFCTYEAKTNRGWVRRATYRIVNSLPYDLEGNPNGYKLNGEVFEECISQTGVLPSAFQRNCTINMKIEATNLFLSDWLACKAGIEQLGQDFDKSNISDTDIVAKHRRHNGELSDEVIIDKKRFVRTCKTFRPKQYFKDYTAATVVYNNRYLKNSIQNDKVPLYGKNAIQYKNYIGIRFDEKHRAIKIRSRIHEAKLNLRRKNKKGGTIKTQPPFEMVLMPLIKAKVSQEQVIDFWKNNVWAKYDLDLPYDGLLSNCVHCMLKGKSKNQLIAKQHSVSSGQSSPMSLPWWARIEKKYSRKVIKSTENNYTNIGFFGVSNKFVYQSWIDELEVINIDVVRQNAESESFNMDCNCTD